MIDILTGTSAFTADGWPGSFYPKGMKPADQGSCPDLIAELVEDVAAKILATK